MAVPFIDEDLKSTRNTINPTEHLPQTRYNGFRKLDSKTCLWMCLVLSLRGSLSTASELSFQLRHRTDNVTSTPRQPVSFDWIYDTNQKVDRLRFTRYRNRSSTKEPIGEWTRTSGFTPDPFVSTILRLKVEPLPNSTEVKVSLTLVDPINYDFDRYYNCELGFGHPESKNNSIKLIMQVYPLPLPPAISSCSGDHGKYNKMKRNIDPYLDQLGHIVFSINVNTPSIFVTLTGVVCRKNGYLSIITSFPSDVPEWNVSGDDVEAVVGQDVEFLWTYTYPFRSAAVITTKQLLNNTEDVAEIGFWYGGLFTTADSFIKRVNFSLTTQHNHDTEIISLKLMNVTSEDFGCYYICYIVLGDGEQITNKQILKEKLVPPNTRSTDDLSTSSSCFTTKPVAAAIATSIVFHFIQLLM